MTLCTTCARGACRSILAGRLLEATTKPATFSAPSTQRTTATATRPREAAQGNVSAAPRSGTREPKSAALVPYFRLQEPEKSSAGPPQNSLAVSDTRSPSLKRRQWIARKELEYVGHDRFKIAKHVEEILNKRNDYEEALFFTRYASKFDKTYTVAWNHLIRHIISENRTHAAIRLYNEMKKRGQVPNAQTFTIIFDGLAKSDHPKMAVAEAVKLYNTMLSSERLPPNIKHLNAVLKVCARAGDLDALFSTLESAEGPRSPDNLTYTTILNALRVRELPRYRSDENQVMNVGEAEQARHEKINISIKRAKAIWAEVIEKWKTGRLWIDEGLVCAMGRVLMTGPRKSNDEVLDLVAQTMNIPRLDKPLLQTPKSKADSTSESQEEPGKESEEEPVAEVDNVLEKVEFNPRATPGYAAVGPNTVSMVMNSLGSTRKTSLAPRYWEIFTKVHGVRPDSENWFRLFRTLAVGKASGHAVEYFRLMPRDLIRPLTAQMVMEACVADNINPHAFWNADEALTTALRNMNKPDPHMMRLYLQAATGNHHKFKEMADEGDVEGSAAALGRQLLVALGRLFEPMRLATNRFQPADLGKGQPKGEDGEEYDEVRELAAVARSMISTIDKLTANKHMVPDDHTLKLLKQRRIVLQKYFDSVYADRHLREPGFEERPRRYGRGEWSERGERRGEERW